MAWGWKRICPQQTRRWIANEQSGMIPPQTILLGNFAVKTKFYLSNPNWSASESTRDSEQKIPRWCFSFHKNFHVAAKNKSYCSKNFHADLWDCRALHRASISSTKIRTAICQKFPQLRASSCFCCLINFPKISHRRKNDTTLAILG